MSWKNGQVPIYVWLRREDVGAKRTNGRTSGGGSRLALGNVKCWTWEPLHEPDKWACYRLVPAKSKRRKKNSK